MVVGAHVRVPGVGDDVAAVRALDDPAGFRGPLNPRIHGARVADARAKAAIIEHAPEKRRAPRVTDVAGRAFLPPVDERPAVRPGRTLGGADVALRPGERARG